MKFEEAKYLHQQDWLPKFSNMEIHPQYVSCHVLEDCHITVLLMQSLKAEVFIMNIRCVSAFKLTGVIMRLKKFLCFEN
jgi:hypothetical protein